MYADVPAGSENAGYINLVSSEGVLTGNGDGTFSPDDGITYASAVTAAIRMLGYTSAEAARPGRMTTSTSPGRSGFQTD